jgi:hypothetical protein
MRDGSSLLPDFNGFILSQLLFGGVLKRRLVLIQFILVAIGLTLSVLLRLFS